MYPAQEVKVMERLKCQRCGAYFHIPWQEWRHFRKPIHCPDCAAEVAYG